MTRKNHLMAALLALGFSGAVFADRIQVEVAAVDKGHTAHEFSTDGTQVWDTTDVKTFSPTVGNCSMFDASKISGSVQLGRLIKIQASTLPSGLVWLHLDYSKVDLERVAPFAVNTSCSLNFATTHKTSYGSDLLLKKGEKLPVGSLMPDAEHVTVSLID